MRQRESDERQEPGVMIWLLRHAKALLILGGAGAMVYGGLTHFATAADVKEIAKSLRMEIKVVSLEARKQRVEDELFRLRNELDKPGTTPQIQRYESELLDTAKRLQDLETRRDFGDERRQ